jgi:hypothetical protein
VTEDHWDEEEREASRARAADEARWFASGSLLDQDDDTWAAHLDDAELDDAELAEADADAEAERAAEDAAIVRGIAAGFGYGYAHIPGTRPLPGTHTGPARAFGQGMPGDTAAPTLTLAGLADQASAASSEDDAAAGRDYAKVNDDQLMGLISARGRIVARQEWEALIAIAEFIRRRPAPSATLVGEARMPSCWSEHAASELRLQLNCTERDADAVLGLAWDLTIKLPATSAALRDGIIDAGKPAS